MMDQALIETSTAMACLVVASVFFVMGLSMGYSSGRTRERIEMLNKLCDAPEEMWQCASCQHPNEMTKDFCGVCGLHSSFTGCPG